MSPTAPAPDRAPSGRSLARELVGLRSIGLLVLALAVAAGFAALSQWQLQRAVQNGSVAPRTTETVRPLTTVARAGAAQTEDSVGQLVTVAGRWVPGDHVVIADRLNRGRTGAWVTGHLLTGGGAQLAVALGWAPDEARARAAAERLDGGGSAAVALLGRYVDDDPAASPDSGPVGRITAMSVPVLLNVWRPLSREPPAFAGYLIDRAAPAGLTTIDSPAPAQTRELNLLNLLYAGEWIVFALVALYLWYRLVRDRWELGQPAEADPTAAGNGVDHEAVAVGVESRAGRSEPHA